VRAYESPPTRIGGSRRAIARWIVVGALVVGAGIGASIASRDSTPFDRSSVTSSVPPTTSTAARSPDPRPSPAALTVGANVDCGTVPAGDCVDAVDAARLAVSDVPFPIVRVQAWPTLICGDDLDCPRPLLAMSKPVGSVVLTFDDRAVAWLNVYHIANDRTDRVLASVVRWFRSP
jgi:hypothetical protein